MEYPEEGKDLEFDAFTSSYLAAFSESDPTWPIRAKIARADFHLCFLANEVRTFLNREPYVTTAERDDEARGYVWRVSIRESPNPRWGLLVSEIAHHLNSALDHVVCLAAERHSGKIPPDTGFPVSKTQKGFRQAWTRASGYYKIRGLSHHAQAIIEDEQPFHRGNAYKAHPLWTLRSIANADKHEALVVLGGSNGKGEVKVSFDGGEVRVAPVKFINGLFEDGDVIARWPLPGPGPKGMKLELGVRFSFRVALAQPDPARGRALLQMLEELRNRVNEIVSRLAPFTA